jgi:hypothetical protein
MPREGGAFSNPRRVRKTAIVTDYWIVRLGGRWRHQYWGKEHD